MYELSNHPGNVLTTVSDIKLTADGNTDGVVDSYAAVITSSQDYYTKLKLQLVQRRTAISYLDNAVETCCSALQIGLKYKSTRYYPFGSLEPGRTYSSADYRFGFNGKENDNEVKGTGNSVDFGARIYDSRLGRWMSVDPFEQKYPSLSPFQFCANNPIFAIDIEGKYIYVVINEYNSETEKTEISICKAESIDDLKQIPGIKVLSQTENGKAEIEKFIQSSENDIYLTVTNLPEYKVEGNLVGGSTYYSENGDGAIDQEKGWNSEEFHDSQKKKAFSNFDGIVPRSGAKTSSFIVVNRAFSDSYKPITTDNMLLLQKGFAKILIHEIYAHVSQKLNGGIPREKEHEEYGETNLGETKEGSPAEEFGKEIDDVNGL
jgi:RHS repeat-associated protein